MPLSSTPRRFTTVLLLALGISLSASASQSSQAQPHPKWPVAGPEVTSVELRPIKTSIKKYTCPAEFKLVSIPGSVRMAVRGPSIR